MTSRRAAGLALVALSVVAACSVVMQRPTAPAQAPRAVAVLAPTVPPPPTPLPTPPVLAAPTTQPSPTLIPMMATSDTPLPTETSNPSATPAARATPQPTTTTAPTPTHATAQVVALGAGDSGRRIVVKPGAQVILELPAGRKWSLPDVNPAVLSPEGSGGGSSFTFTARSPGTTTITTVGVCRAEVKACDGQITNYRVTVVVG